MSNDWLLTNVGKITFKDFAASPAVAGEINRNGNTQQSLETYLNGAVRIVDVRKANSIGEHLAVGSYVLTTTMAILNFSTSGNFQITIPEAGTYEIIAQIIDDMSAVTASAALNASVFAVYLDGVLVANSRRLGMQTSILAAAITGVNGMTHTFRWTVTTTAVNQVISVWGRTIGAVTGNWIVWGGATVPVARGWAVDANSALSYNKCL